MVDPTEAEKPPVDESWVHEIKWDGYRVQAHVENGRSQLFTAKFGAAVARAVADLGVRTAILDGEMVALVKDGRSDFHELRRQLGQPSSKLTYQVFDLLWLNGEDLRPMHLVERKNLLRNLLFGIESPLVYVDSIEAPGQLVLQEACRSGMEGIVAKRPDSPYKAGRSDAWLKIKCEVTETLVVVGFSLDDNDNIDGVFLGRPQGDVLGYAGQVDNGISDDDFAELEHRLRPLVMSTPAPIEKPKGKTRANWTRPELLVEVTYPNKSEDGRLRHPRWKGFRDDLVKPARRRPRAKVPTRRKR